MAAHPSDPDAVNKPLESTLPISRAVQQRMTLESRGKLIVRRPSSSEHARVRNIVQRVVDETYGGLWAEPPLRIDEEDWSLAWIALIGLKIAGMTLTHREWVSDLWVLSRFRGIGAGTVLRVAAETEIAGRGCGIGRLRLVESNWKALSFYGERGWRVQGKYPHEHLPITMIEMEKRLLRTG